MQAAFLSTRTRGAAVLIGIPRADAVLSAAGADDPAHGAARARLDLRLVEARARLPARRSTLYRAGGFRSTGSSRTGSRSSEVERAFELMHSGEALRVVLDPTAAEEQHEPRRAGRPDRRGLGRTAPNGSHVNVVLAQRGSPTAAAAISMFAHPSPGHSPVLCCVGPDAAGVRADLAADADDEQGDRARRRDTRR